MILKDNMSPVGHFKIQSIDKNGNVIDEYAEKNLIMDLARSNMAELVGGYSTSSSPINRFVIGTLGYNGDILTPINVGELGFDSTRTQLFSQENNAHNYVIDFDVTSALADVTVTPVGSRYTGTTLEETDTNTNTIQRVVADRVVTYTITIPAENGNSGLTNPTVAYTEAALYAGSDIFSMKTFVARVKEDTVKFVITWSIIF